MRAEGIETVRRILCVFPRYTSSFGTFEYAYPLTDGVQAFMPPQGLLLIAAYLPAQLAGPLRRREHPPRHAGRFRNGRRRCSSAACTSSASR